MDYGSKYVNQAVEAFAQLPGIGRKSALRFVLHMLKWPKDQALHFSDSFGQLVENIKYCKTCKNLSDSEHCSICTNPSRSDAHICVVADIRDVLAIENTQAFRGKYHVLGGLISPMDGIGPHDLSLDALFKRIQEGKIEEITLALSGSMEGDTTNYYIYNKLKDYKLNVTTIARGIAVGDELEYADEITLGKSITNRLPYADTLKS